MALATTSKATLQNARMMCCWEIFLGTPSTKGPPCRHAGNLATLLTEGMNSINGASQADCFHGGSTHSTSAKPNGTMASCRKVLELPVGAFSARGTFLESCKGRRGAEEGVRSATPAETELRETTQLEKCDAAVGFSRFCAFVSPRVRLRCFALVRCSS